jgi:hypothetical protein
MRPHIQQLIVHLKQRLQRVPAGVVEAIAGSNVRIVSEKLVVQLVECEQFANALAHHIGTLFGQLAQTVRFNAKFFQRAKKRIFVQQMNPNGRGLVVRNLMMLIAMIHHQLSDCCDVDDDVIVVNVGSR